MASSVTVVKLGGTFGIVALVDMEIVHESPHGIGFSAGTVMPNTDMSFSSSVDDLVIDSSWEGFFSVGHCFYDSDIIGGGVRIQLDAHCPILPRVNWEAFRIIMYLPNSTILSIDLYFAAVAGYNDTEISIKSVSCFLENHLSYPSISSILEHKNPSTNREIYG